MLNIYMKRIFEALIRSWESDKVACVFEFFGTAFTIIASLTLAITAKDPNMAIIFPIYQLGSVAFAVAYYRRDMFWSNGLMWYFIGANTYGFLVAVDIF